MKPVAYPYPVLPASALPDPEWFLASGDDLTSLRDGIDAWDAELPLDLHASLAAWPAFDDLFQSSGLGEAFQHASLNVLVETGPSPITGHRFTAFKKPLQSIERESGITVNLDSSLLIEKVTLHLLITVDSCTVPGFELKAGSVLFRYAFSFPLEGSFAKFPVRPVSFAEQKLSPGFWQIDVGLISDLDQSLLGTLLVYLNNDHVDVIERLNSGNDRALECLFQADIVATVLQVILGDDSLEPEIGQTYAEGSIGEAASGWLAGLRDDAASLLTVPMLREEMVSRPGVFRARCQAFAQMEVDE